MTPGSPRRSFLDGPDVTWTDMLKLRARRLQILSVQTRLAQTDDPFELALLRSELNLLREESEDHEII